MYCQCPTFEVSTGPTTEPLTLEELKDRIRITGCDFDTELSALLTAARQQVENDTYRKLITQTVKMYLEDFPHDYADIEIRLAPISAITSVKYYDQDDAEQTFAAAKYYSDLTSTPPRIALKESYSWETVHRYRPNPVTVTMTAGYGARSAVPAIAKLAIVEWVKSVWMGCEGNTATYQRLISGLQWTGYHKVCS